MDSLSGFDYFAMIAALVLVMVVLCTKLVTHYREEDMRKTLGEIGRIRHDMLKSVKAAQNEKELAERNLAGLTKRKTKTAKRLVRTKKKAAKLAANDDKRRKRFRTPVEEDQAPT